MSRTTPRRLTCRPPVLWFAYVVDPDLRLAIRCLADQGRGEHLTGESDDRRVVEVQIDQIAATLRSNPREIRSHDASLCAIRHRPMSSRRYASPPSSSIAALLSAGVGFPA